MLLARLISRFYVQLCKVHFLERGMQLQSLWLIPNTTATPVHSIEQPWCQSSKYLQPSLPHLVLSDLGNVKVRLQEYFLFLFNIQF